jgi:hypothetical protein
METRNHTSLALLDLLSRHVDSQLSNKNYNSLCRDRRRSSHNQCHTCTFVSTTYLSCTMTIKCRWGRTGPREDSLSP